MKKVLLIVLSSFLFIVNVNAASKCSYEEQAELNSKAGNIKVSYDIGTRQVETFEGDMIDIDQFVLSIVNVTEEFYVTVKNNYNKEEKTFSYKNAKDGVITYNWPHFDKVTNFTFNVFTSEKTKCHGEKVKTIYFSTPKYNTFSYLNICDEYTDFDYCKKYVYINDISENDFYNSLEKYEARKQAQNREDEKEQKDFLTNVISFITKNKWLIAGGLIVIGGAGYSIYRVKTKKQRDLGL